MKINDLELERSYFSISWNPINSFHNQTSFLSYYLFNSTLIGILPIKFDYNIWLAKIGYDNNEILSKRGKELIDSINKVENYLYNYSFSYSSDYDFYLKNKFFLQNKYKRFVKKFYIYIFNKILFIFLKIRYYRRKNIFIKINYSLI